MTKEIETFLKMIQESNNIVFFGGAGVSTESGVPDFRSKDGLYNQRDIKFEKYSPEYLLSHTCLVRHTEVFFEYYRQKMDSREIQPNITHKVLAKWEEEGKLSAVVTQNIDGLHQKAGSKRVYELHGTTLRNYCNQCGKEYEADYIFESKEYIPRCQCGGIVRPYVTLYEEGLPEDAVNGAINAISNADMLIIGGTSLTVAPACNLIYDFCGEHLVIINKDSLKEKTMINPDSDLIINASLGEVFSKILF